MRIPRHHEQTQVCRLWAPGRQTSLIRRRLSGHRLLLVAAIAAALMAVGAAPALTQPAHAVERQTVNTERIHQSLPAETAEEVISAAESQAGTPYAWGGTGPDSFDCSGLVQWAYGQAGISLPRVAHDQVNAGSRVSYADAERGDLLYWADGGGHAYHVAIYLGGGRMIDAPSSGGTVGERDVTRHNLAGAVRL